MNLSRSFLSIWMFSVLIVNGLSTSNNKCLKNLEEVHPKKYYSHNGTSLNITILVSDRLTHRLTTQVFYIFLKEVLGYTQVELVQYDDNFQVESVIEKLTDYSDLIRAGVPPAMIDLEVWVPPEYDTFKVELIDECGSVAPPGRFGWFVPVDMNGPVKKYYKKLGTTWSDDIREIHWTFLRDLNTVAAFDIDSMVLERLEEYAKVNSETKEYVCNSAICTRSMFIPDHCRTKKCAVLLAPEYNATNFVTNHINELKLYVKVLWLGKHLSKGIEFLTNYYKNQTKPTANSIIILNWTPSDIILHEHNFISVAFKHCELLKTDEQECKYEMHRLVKFGWSKIKTESKHLYEVVRSFKFDQIHYNYLLELYENNTHLNDYEIACEWMRKENQTWMKWKKSTENKIYIGGIFPMTGSSYGGEGIMWGAHMAQEAINNNRSILPDYKLEIIVTDGKCSADNVMRIFIDFIVEEYYKNMIGVLGPACSDTVEPLAGVSRHYRVMVISYSAEGASFSQQKYPYFFRTIGENSHYIHVYLELFKKLGWKRVAALTEDGQKYTEYISLMQDLLEKNNIKFIANKKFPRERETAAMRGYLADLKSKRAFIIIADVFDDVARVVMCEAYKSEMTSAQGYVWFLPMWLNTTWYNTDYFNKYLHENVNCTTAEMIKAINGYFGMTHAYFGEDDAIMQENITVREWRTKYKNTSKPTSNYAGFAYDAVWTYALALDNLSRTDPQALSNLHSESTTNKLVSLVKSTNMNGVSGLIKFHGGPSRFSKINIMEWYDNSTHVIGQFIPNLTEARPDIRGGTLKWNNSSNIRWFTPNGRQPEDGTLPESECALQSLADFFQVECTTSIIILNLIVAATVILILITVCLLMKRKYDKKVLDAEQRMIKSLGLPLIMNGTSDLDKWEVPREKVVINRKLGEGAFGTVYGGEANLPDTGWVPIAVKTLKIGSSTEQKLDFLSEADIMKRFDHKNIVKLLGVCTKEEPVYTIMELMLYGDLKTYLLGRRHLVNGNTEESEDVSSKKLTSMALDVARGLSYLAAMKYVHRDVASRNCLVNAQRVVKLGDFGMTRAMFENDYYKFNRKGMLPVRWMSPESLGLGVFTPASDVWSYGVLLYEIITFGSFPFQGKSNSQVLEMVKSGHTLDIPKGVRPQLEGLIKSCWSIDAKKRPPASEIVEFLANNPRLLSPCPDVPLASVQLEDTDQLEVHLPSDLRKSSNASFKGSPINGKLLPTSQQQQQTTSSKMTQRQQSMPDCAIPLSPLENCCPKEPLLGSARSSSSLLNFSKFGSKQRRDSNGEDEEEIYNDQSPPNGHVVTKV